MKTVQTPPVMKKAVMKALKDFNKSDKDKKTEEISEKVDAFALDAEEQIGLRQIELKRLSNSLDKEKRNKEKAEKLKSSNDFVFEGDFDSYIERIKSGNKAVAVADKAISDIESEIEKTEKEIAFYSEIKTKLSE